MSLLLFRWFLLGVLFLQRLWRFNPQSAMFCICQWERSGKHQIFAWNSTPIPFDRAEALSSSNFIWSLLFYRFKSFLTQPLCPFSSLRLFLNITTCRSFTSPQITTSQVLLVFNTPADWSIHFIIHIPTAEKYSWPQTLPPISRQNAHLWFLNNKTWVFNKECQWFLSSFCLMK